MDEDRKGRATRSSQARCTRVAHALVALWVLAAAAACGDGVADGGQAEVTDRRSDARLAASATTTVACAGGARSVVLLVDPTLVTGIRARLDRFEQDLCQDGYTAIEHPASFVTPAEVRAYLADTARARNLAGTRPDRQRSVRVPAGHVAVVESVDPELLRGDHQLPVLLRPRRHLHEERGIHIARAPHLVVRPARRQPRFRAMGRRAPALQGRPPQSIAALNRYFDKNHAYRTGARSPRAASWMSPSIS